MDRNSYRSKETEAIFQIPDTGAGKRVPLQRLRLETETVGISPEFESDWTSSENMVPESQNEEQEDQSEKCGKQPEQYKHGQQ